VSDEVDDPFLSITENSLNLSNGNVFQRKKRSTYGKMIPFNACGRTLNIGPDCKS
jgi:hypothetical protein